MFNRLRDALFAALALISASGTAQANCALRDVFAARLESKYAETQRSWGLDMDGTVLEFWAADSGTWTILRTIPIGISCTIGAGEGALVPNREWPWVNPQPKRSL